MAAGPSELPPEKGDLEQREHMNGGIETGGLISMESICIFFIREIGEVQIIEDNPWVIASRGEEGEVGQERRFVSVDSRGIHTCTSERAAIRFEGENSKNREGAMGGAAQIKNKGVLGKYNATGHTNFILGDVG